MITFQVGSTVALPKAGESLRIGRDAANDIVLPTKSVSRFHAEIVCKDGSWVIKDWDSYNGTYVNGERVQSSPLRSDDAVEIAGFWFRCSGEQLQCVEAKDVDVGEAASVGDRLPRTQREKRKISSGRLIRLRRSGRLSGRPPRASGRPRGSGRAASGMPRAEAARRAPPTPPLSRTGEAFRIGHDPSNQLVLNSPKISRFHAEIFFKDASFCLQDRNSDEGTFVNGTKVQSAELKVGDVIGLGDFHFRFDGTRLLWTRPREKSGSATASPAVSSAVAARKLLRSGLVLAALLAWATIWVAWGTWQRSQMAAPPISPSRSPGPAMSAIPAPSAATTPSQRRSGPRPAIAPSAAPLLIP